MMIVYKSTNKTNGKVYIGITKTSLRRRISAHLSSSRTRPFARALAKYGVDGFAWEVVATCATTKELYATECRLIAELNCRAETGWGYNRTAGGAGKNGMVVTEETKRKISLAGKGKQRHLKIPDSARDDIFLRQLAGDHQSAIAAAYHVTREAITHYIKRHRGDAPLFDWRSVYKLSDQGRKNMGRPGNQHNLKIPDSDRDIIFARRAAGEFNRVIAETYGATSVAICKYIKRHKAAA